MMKSEDVLQFCLQEIRAKRKTLAECVALFPEIQNLEAQLLLALHLRSEAPRLRPEANQRIEAYLREQFQVTTHRTKPARSTRTLHWIPALLISVLLFASVGTVAASAGSLPGEPLYTVKRGSESAQVFLTPSTGQAALHATLAERRLAEFQTLSTQGTFNTELLADLTTETETAFAAVEAAAPEKQTEILETLVQLTDHQQAVLQAVKAKAPPAAQAGLARALEASSKHNQSARGQAGKGNSGHGPSNCRAKSPKSPNYCTPTPPPSIATPLPF